MDSDSRVTLTRTSEEDVKQRQVILKLDGEWIGDLMYGRKISRKIPPGRHTLNVNNTWNRKTIQFTAEPGEEVKFKVVNRAGRFTWFLVATLGAGPIYVSVEREA